MKRRSLRRSLLTMALAVTVVAGGAGSVQAYLKGPAPGVPIGPGDTPDYLSNPNWGFTKPIRKFVDLLPGVPGLTTYNTAANGYDPVTGANNLGQIMPIAVADTTTYPGSDYYEISLVQYTEQMHTDLAPTTLRAYIQTNVDTLAHPELAQPHHLGPIIVAQQNRPVRVKFTNELPADAGGDLFVPVDTSIMGSGPYTIDYDPVTKQPIPEVSGTFVQSRATLHLHGGNTPWISDGTPHQWVAPAGADPVYPRGTSSKNVPDMPDPGDGAATFYWTNQQSSRLMFYHDHAWGITRLNVYVGQAAGYVITDPVEAELEGAGLIPSDLIPLVIEDKTFVDANTIIDTDPTWAWGTQPWDGTPGAPMTPVDGDLWWPHIYMSAENPFDITGVAPMGRWAYGPYFWPPTTNIPYPPVANTEYYNVDCDVDDPLQNEGNTLGYVTYNGVNFCQPPEIPGTPNPSWGAEAFMDTPVINGTAYPVLKVEPKAYRFRILNAAHDRFYNLQLYQAVTAAGQADCIGAGLNCADNSEIKYVPALDYTAYTPATPGWPSSGTNPQPDTWAMDARTGGAPDWNTVGPSWLQIGTDSGFLPRPVVLENNPVTWNTDPTTFTAGLVNGGTLTLAPAERADVIIDFSAYDGQTLILYNDAPAPFPALDPHYDYFTGAEDMTDAGGLPPTPVGLGPNTRTLMQIQVAATTPAPFDPAPLNAAFETGAGTTLGAPVFVAAQHPIVVGQAAYNGLYTSNPTFPTKFPYWGVSRIGDNFIGFEDVNGANQSVYMEPKAIQDEMGETYDDYGRLSAKLGLEMSFTTAGVQTFVLQNYVDPSTEILQEEAVQIWKVTHNGVDTHPLHFHLYDVQLINRVGWDGFITMPAANELGWKDTVRISPLEDTIIALRPTTPRLPFGVPESIRPLNPMEPLGSTNGFTTLDPLTGQPRDPIVTNEMTNYDWEYVIHCHILSHEENDMMRTVVYGFVEEYLPPVTGVNWVSGGVDTLDVSWNDPVPVDYADLGTFGNHANEIGFVIQRSANNGPFAPVGFALANDTLYSDATAVAGPTYRYRVVAYNALGYSHIADSIGLFRPSNRSWYLDMNANGQYNAGIDYTTVMGQSTDAPVVGDWDGDGKTELGLYRNGRWYLDLNGNGTWDGTPTDKQINSFGTATDIPLVGDWNGDGISEVGYYRPSTMNFYLDVNGNGLWDAGVDRQTQLGLSGDQPVVGDWTGDGIDKIGVFRPSDRRWYLDANNNGLYDAGIDLLRGIFGASTDIPVAGDWTGDGIDKIGVYRPANRMWYLDADNNGTYSAGSDLTLGIFGQSTDKPLVGKW